MKPIMELTVYQRLSPLPWDIRLKVLIGAARGMAFLHTSEMQVIYRDFKASNILLDNSYHAKICDFGLAKMGPAVGYSHVTTRVMGTNGYAAPEYIATAPMSRRTSNTTLGGNTVYNERTDKSSLGPTLRIFSIEELEAATKNLSSDTIIGEGGFGKVYKGWIHDNPKEKKGSGSIVAIKKLNHESMQGFKEWQSEVKFLGKLSHPNLVKLLGYGWDDKVLFLVYEFMQNESLENHLSGSRGPPLQPMPWDIRLRIAIGAARGLAFLHTSDAKIIHRDFKASNILLDEVKRTSLSILKG